MNDLNGFFSLLRVLTVSGRTLKDGLKDAAAQLEDNADARTAGEVTLKSFCDKALLELDADKSFGHIIVEHAKLPPVYRALFAAGDIGDLRALGEVVAIAQSLFRGR